MAYILSLPDSWELCSEHLYNCSDMDGKTAVQSAIRELIELGYIAIEYERDAVTKRITGKRYVAYDDPSDNMQAIRLETNKTENLTNGEQATIKETLEIKETLSHKPASDDAEKEAIYQAYPSKRRGGRKEAYKAIRSALKDIDAATLLARVKAYAASVEVRDKLRAGEANFLPMLATWLNKGRYDEDTTVAPAGTPVRSFARPSLPEPANWRAILDREYPGSSYSSTGVYSHLTWATMRDSEREGIVWAVANHGGTA